MLPAPRRRAGGSTGSMLADALPRKDQRAKGELYLRVLLMGGRRKSMQPMAKRLGWTIKGCSSFITSSTWDYKAARAAVARWGVQAISPEAYVIDDTVSEGRKQFAAGGPDVFRHAGQDRQIPDRRERATGQPTRRRWRRNWRLFLPRVLGRHHHRRPAEGRTGPPTAGAGGCPTRVRHHQNSRLALDMLDQMTGDWGMPKLPVTADALRRHHRVPPRPGEPWPALRGGGQADHQRPHRDHDTSTDTQQCTRTATQAALPRRAIESA
jgi:DDE superfamily endonuclease